MNYVPESPRWLLARHRKAKLEEARDVLEHAAKANGAYNDETDQKIEDLIQLKSRADVKAKLQLHFHHLFK